MEIKDLFIKLNWKLVVIFFEQQAVDRENREAPARVRRPKREERRGRCTKQARCKPIISQSKTVVR